MFIIGILLGLCAGVAATLGIQAVAEHKSYADAASSEVKQVVSDGVAEIKKLLGKV